jgi:hypothetical protein
MFQHISLEDYVVFVCRFSMGYLGYFYVEAKAFEVQSEIGNNGIRLAERSKGVYGAVCLGKPLVGWLTKTWRN